MNDRRATIFMVLAFVFGLGVGMAVGEGWGYKRAWGELLVTMQESGL